MDDEPRSCRRADGMSKIGYRTKASAKRARQRWRTIDGQNDRGIMDIYRCVNCGLWHIGTSQSKLRKREAKKGSE